MAGPAASTPGARCARHPDVAAVAVCSRCGGFLCGACTEVRDETAYCEPCVDWRVRNTRPSRAVGVLLVANVVALGLLLRLVPPVGSLLAGGAGAFLAAWESRRLKRAGGTPRSRLPARVLAALAGVNLLAVGLWFALGVYLMLLRR